MMEGALIKLTLPLEYQQDIFREVREEDSLVILAKGLGLQRIVTNLLHSYDAAGDNLVLLIGAESDENLKFGEALAEHVAISKNGVARGLRVVNTDVTSVGSRQVMYAKGGLFTVTSRILVVDLLTGLLNPETITGIVVLHAEKVIATSLEAFILRILRQKNKEAFIKAFSDSPDSFVSGFAPLSTMMRNLFIRKPSLWPRYHLTVAKSLEIKKAEVVELEVAMTDAMKEIQNAILQCIEVSISELRKANAALDVDDWSVDSALHKNFDNIIRRQLEPVWHRVSWRTREIARDLTTLRTMLQILLTSDCVSFHKYMETILATSTPPPGSTKQTQSPWLFLDAAQVIFSTAKRRVYSGSFKQQDLAASASTIPENLHLVLEEQPKWNVLSEILEELEHFHSSEPKSATRTGTTLIMCSDSAVCKQVREYLQTKHEHEIIKSESGEDSEQYPRGGTILLRRKLRGYFAWKRDFAKFHILAQAAKQNKSTYEQANDRDRADFRGRGGPANKRRRTRGGGQVGKQTNGSVGVTVIEDDSTGIVNLMQESAIDDGQYEIKEEVVVDPMEHLEDFYALHDMGNLVVVHPFNSDMDDYLLEELRPSNIVLYEPDAAFIRRIEVFRSSHRDNDVKVYFLYYGGSTEEQRYLSAVRREKDSFTKLIREKGNMSVVLTLDARGVEDPQEQFLRTINTRIAGGGRLTATVQQPRVIVDVREFRSSLPSLIHGRNVEIIPCTLTVGDYILTDNICVERKSVKDLISSFKDGRLFAQAESMFLYYKSPMLLIEFDQYKSFNLEPFADLTTQNVNQNDLQTKLVLLNLAFPKLKVIWSSSPYQTAEIFEELKKGHGEPNPVTAVSYGLDQGKGTGGTYVQTPMEMLRTIPGITAKNYMNVMVECESLTELSIMTQTDITKMIGPESGRKVHRFMNNSIYE